jgi:HEAT repeat protein
MMRRSAIIELLRGRDRRSIGNSNRVVKLVLADAKKFPALFAGLRDEDEMVRMRAADALEKITIARPGLLQKHKRELLGLLAEAEQIELRWHLALMAPRLELSPAERRRAVESLLRYLEDRSSIVKTCALQALADFAQQDAGLQETARRVLEESRQNGTAAMKARARRLLKGLKE